MTSRQTPTAGHLQGGPAWLDQVCALASFRVMPDSSDKQVTAQSPRAPYPSHVISLAVLSHKARGRQMSLEDMQHL